MPRRVIADTSITTTVATDSTGVIGMPMTEVPNWRGAWTVVGATGGE